MTKVNAEDRGRIFKVVRRAEALSPYPDTFLDSVVPTDWPINAPNELS